MVRQRRDFSSPGETLSARIAKGDVFELTVAGRHLVAGKTVLTITGLRGEYIFHAARVVDGEVQWLQLFGGVSDRQAWRYVEASRIRVKKRTGATVERLKERTEDV